jgi:hypothetical protein
LHIECLPHQVRLLELLRHLQWLHAAGVAACVWLHAAGLSRRLWLLPRAWLGLWLPAARDAGCALPLAALFHAPIACLSAVALFPETLLGSELTIHPDHAEKCARNTWLRGVVYLTVPPQHLSRLTHASQLVDGLVVLPAPADDDELSPRRIRMDPDLPYEEGEDGFLIRVSGGAAAGAAGSAEKGRCGRVERRAGRDERRATPPLHPPTALSAQHSATIEPPSPLSAAAAVLLKEPLLPNKEPAPRSGVRGHRRTRSAGVSMPEASEASTSLADELSPRRAAKVAASLGLHGSGQAAAFAGVHRWIFTSDCL